MALGFKYLLGISLACLLLSSCTGTLLLPKGQKLYTGAKLKLKPANKHWKTDELEAALAKNLVLPRRNRKFLWMRNRVGVYNLFHNAKKEKGFRNWVANQLGKPPVLYQESILKQHQKAMRETAAEFGFFSVDIQSKAKGFWKKRKIRHKIRLLLPAKVLGELKYPLDTGAVEHRLAQLQQTSLLKPGKAYRFENLALEQQRLADSLRNDGWFNFSPDHLLFEADTLQGDGKVNLHLRFKDDVTASDKRRYRISEIIVYPDNDPKIAGEMGQKMEPFDDCTSFVFSEMPLKKRVILDNLRFHCGEYFSNENYRNSLFRLLNLGYFKFVNIRFEQSAMADSLLEAHVYLTPQIPQKVEASLSGIFSQNYYGAQGGLSWQHRNLFRGAENLRMSWDGNFLVTGDQGNLITSKIRAQLTLPQKIPGFKMRQKNALTATRLSLQHDLLYFEIILDNDDKIGVHINKFGGEGGFTWKKDRQGSITQSFNPISASIQVSGFSKAGTKRDVLEEIPNDDTGEYLIFATLLELSPNYTLLYDSRLGKSNKLSSFFRQYWSLRTNGYLLPKDIAKAADLGNSFNLFTESDFRQYLRLSPKTSLAYRLSFFTGLGLTQKSNIPSLDLYTIGGPSSVRSFRPRSIGPGSTPLDDTDATDGVISLTDHVGNLQILGSIELRQQIGKKWELATFFDTGNTWLTKASSDLPGGTFSKGFIREFASGAGLGLRYNLSLFILRLDLAIPISKPYLPTGSRWIGQAGFGGAPLRGNFAFGYPF